MIFFFGSLTGFMTFYFFVWLTIGIIIFIAGFRWLKQKNLIENIPTSKIRSLAMGLVEICGNVLPFQKKVLKSPLTQKDCVYYQYIVEMQKDRKDSSAWIPIRIGRDSTHFILKDETGSVLVDPEGAKVNVTEDYSFITGKRKKIPIEIQEFIKKINIREKDIFGYYRSLRLKEYVIALGDRLHVMGTAGDNPFREEGTAMHSMEDIMIRKGGIDKAFYISDSPEKEILKSLRFKSALAIIIGALVLIGSLAMFIYMTSSSLIA